MTSLLPCFLLAASLASSPQSAPKQPSLLESLKQFEGHWKGDFGMGSLKMDIDMVWKTFAGKWVEVSYTYSSPQMKIDYRVMMSTNADNSGFNLWMFGSDASTPDQMTGAMDGKTFNVVHNRANQPDVKFWIDGQKNMVMSVVNSDEKHTEIGHGVLKPVKE